MSNLKDFIQQTPTYQSLNPIAKKMLLSYNSIKAMKHNVTLVKNVGYERFERISAAIPRNKQIVKELIELNLIA